MSTSDTKGNTQQDTRKKGMAGATVDDGTAKAGSGSGTGGTPSGNVPPKDKPKPKDK